MPNRLSNGTGPRSPLLSTPERCWTATVPAQLLTTAGDQIISVSNGPGFVSNQFAFLVSPPAPSISSLSSSTVAEGGPAAALTVTGAGFLGGADCREWWLHPIVRYFRRSCSRYNLCRPQPPVRHAPPGVNHVWVAYGPGLGGAGCFGVPAVSSPCPANFRLGSISCILRPGRGRIYSYGDWRGLRGCAELQWNELLADPRCFRQHQPADHIRQRDAVDGHRSGSPSDRGRQLSRNRGQQCAGFQCPFVFGFRSRAQQH